MFHGFLGSKLKYHFPPTEFSNFLAIENQKRSGCAAIQLHLL